MTVLELYQQTYKLVTEGHHDLEVVAIVSSSGANYPISVGTPEEPTAGDRGMGELERLPEGAKYLPLHLG